MNAKQFAGKLAWRLALVLNVLASFLAISYSLPLLHSKDDITRLVGKEVLGIWLYAEVVFGLLTLAVQLVVKERREAHHG